MIGDTVNGVGGCHADCMISEGVRIWPILQY